MPKKEKRATHNKSASAAVPTKQAASGASTGESFTPKKKAPTRKRRIVAKPGKPTPRKPTHTKAKKARSTRTRRKALKPDEIAEIFKRFAEIEPAPKGELESVNVYTLLVAVVLSAQATDAGVNKATRKLFAVADTPEKMLKLGEDKVRDHIKSIGLFRNKAKNVIALSKKLVDDFGSNVPRDRDTLETLPGVGRKTANVVMNVAFGEPTMAVDTHVGRVSNRMGLSQGTTPLAVEKDLLKKIPKEYGVPAHHWLILHGRYLCKARKPECWRCPVEDLCLFPDKTEPS